MPILSSNLLKVPHHLDDEELAFKGILDQKTQGRELFDFDEEIELELKIDDKEQLKLLSNISDHLTEVDALS